MICATADELHEAQITAGDPTDEAKREPMPKAVLRRRRKSCTLSPDMDAQLNQVRDLLFVWTVG